MPDGRVESKLLSGGCGPQRPLGGCLGKIKWFSFTANCWVTSFLVRKAVAVMLTF